jgi:hypothetical protein
MKYRLDTDPNLEKPVGVTATDINGAEISAPSQGRAPAKLIVNKDLDRSKGIKTPGIVEGFSYDTADGKTRHKYETLVSYSQNTVKKLAALDEETNP